MSLSDTLTKYRMALLASQQRQESLYDKRSQNVRQFYDKFLNGMIRRYSSKMRDPKWYTDLLNDFKGFFGCNNISFVAVDGTSDKVQLEEYAVFFAASYGVKGAFSLDNSNKVSYQKRPIKDELSMVAYVPIPFAELDDVSPSELDDDNRFSMMDIHNKLMILAEVYLIYNEITSSSYPQVVLWDQSFSGMFHWRAPPIKDVPMITKGYEYNGRKLTVADALVARSHPYNDTLDVPAASKGYFNMPNRIIKELFQSTGNATRVSKLAKLFGESEGEVRRVIEKFIIEHTKIQGQNSNNSDYSNNYNNVGNNGVGNAGATSQRPRHATNDKEGNYSPELLEYSRNSDIIRLNSRYNDSWEFVVELVDFICNKIFKEKEAKALSYKDSWITTVDIDFMISILLRKIIEEAWEKNILLLGIVKDSASKYFTRNYLGVMRKHNFYDDYSLKDLFGLLWTDRLTMESLPSEDHQLDSPWTTVEYDSVFQTVYLTTKKQPPQVYVRAVPTSERIFARTLALLFSSRKKSDVTFNHVLFLDRILVPHFDQYKIKKYKLFANAEEKQVNLFPFVDLDNAKQNPVLDFVIFFLDKLTTNKFADVIGYPEPLHKADLGAKTFNRMVQPMIRSSTKLIKRTNKPWASSVRSKRRFR